MLATVLEHMNLFHIHKMHVFHIFQAEVLATILKDDIFFKLMKKSGLVLV